MNGDTNRECSINKKLQNIVLVKETAEETPIQ